MRVTTASLVVGFASVALIGLASCSGSGGLPAVKFFFGTNGAGACSALTVSVDLDAASSVTALENDGSPSCDLSATLVALGCQATFTSAVVAGANTLAANISGCSIPDSADVFECRFTAANADQIGPATAASCTCQQDGCDRTPPVCVNQDPSPGACEICDNGIDDDGNGLVDCEDPNCRHFPQCRGDTTTTSLP
ncbi:MAG TPA: hypothetical protein VGK20_09005 [Candidatus Binatia bacterium]|jgi:hypothetical protein